MMDIGYAGALIAGLLSFLTPCILPMVPFYLSYLAGLSMNELRSSNGLAPASHRRLIASSVLFSAGVTSIFVLLGLGATAVGQVFINWHRPLSYLAAAVLAVFGLHFLGVLRLPFLYRQLKVDGPAKVSSLWGAYAMGLAFGFGWTPCVGPALAAILMVASGSGDLFKGASLLFVFGAGMTLPFILAAVFAKPFLKWAARGKSWLGHVEKLMGVMLLVFAALIATDSITLIADWMLRNFDWSATLR